MNIGIYLRLSDDDGDISGFKPESNSISNQRAVIMEYISEHSDLSGENIIEYCDDGHTGVNFKRTGVSKLLGDVRQGIIQCIVVKDLSRFGRNLVEVGDYLEQIFPLLNVRFIAINDGYDSKKAQSADTFNIDIAFRNLMNENYSRDISAKVKSVKQLHKQQGLFLGGLAPYGYKVVDKRLIVDENKAENVRLIFQLASKNMPFIDIANYLNAKGIKKGNGYWSAKTVSHILHNVVYIGTLIQNRTETFAPKMSKNNDESQWIVFEDHHQPIISKELFNKIKQRTYKKTSKQAVKSYFDELKGKVRCGGCGKVPKRHFIGSGENRQFYYKCDYPVSENCCSDRLYADELKAAVIKAMDMQLTIAYEKIDKLKIKMSDEKTNTENDIKKLAEKLNLLRNKKMSLYTDYKSGILSKEDFISQRNHISDMISDIEIKTEKLNNIKTDILKKSENLLQKTICDKLPKEQLIKQLVKEIHIYPGKRIEIAWNFEDIFEEKNKT